MPIAAQRVAAGFEVRTHRLVRDDLVGRETFHCSPAGEISVTHTIEGTFEELVRKNSSRNELAQVGGQLIIVIDGVKQQRLSDLTQLARTSPECHFGLAFTEPR